MLEFLDALARYTFLQNALIGGALAGIGCGVMGSYVVVKRIGFLAGGIAHSVLGGMGAALFFGFSPTVGALGTALAAALAIGWISLHWREQEETLISAFWAVGMATGILFIDQTPGYAVDLMSYLFGDILMVSGDHLAIMGGMDLVILATVALFHRQFLAITFDEEFATLRGVPVTPLYLLLLCMVAITVVLLVQVVGLILVIALLTLPAAIAARFARTLTRMMLIATLLGIAFSTTGLIIAFHSNLPAGATIILTAGATYMGITAYSGIRRRRKW